MSNGLNSPAPNVVRVRLQVLCNFHAPVLRAGEEKLRAAMAEYAASCPIFSDRPGGCRS